MRLALQISMFIIPPVFLALAKDARIWGRVKHFILSFIIINSFVYAVSYFFKGVKIIPPYYYMTYSFGIKWLTLGMVFAGCYLIWDKYLVKYWRLFDVKRKYIIIIILQVFFLSVSILLLCCKEYPKIEITDKMIPSEHACRDDSGAWYISDNNRDIILSGPYLSLEKGTYTITIDYESEYAQYMLVQSAENPASLEKEDGIFLGGGRQTRKAYIRVTERLDDLDIQIRYSGKGNIRINHIWIEENSALYIEYIVLIVVLFLVWDIWKYLYDIRKVLCPSQKFIKVLGSSILSTTAIAVTGNVRHDGTFFYLIRNESNGSGIVYLIAGIGIFAFYKRFLISKAEYNNVVKCLAGIFSACMIIGISMSSNGDLRFVLNSPLQFGVCIMTAVGYYILFRTCLAYVFKKLDTAQLNIALKIYKEHTYGITLGILAAMWLPVWICFWPASVTTDGLYQLHMALGIVEFSNYHPWLSTMLMKLFFEMGHIVNDNMGLLFVALSNILFELMIYSYVCYKIRQITGDILYIAAILFYGINPLFSLYGQVIVKDTPYAAIFTLFMVCYMECVFKSKQGGIVDHKRLFLLAMIGIAVCALRKNGVYAVLPSYICLLLVTTSRKKKLLILCLGCFMACSFIMIDRIIPDKLGIAKGSTREMLSIPFQQTARYFRDYEAEVTDYEYEVIDRVLDAGRLKELYQREISDNVKGTYKGGETNDGLSEYFKVWAGMLWKHPVTYIEATLNNSYAYYYPFVYIGKPIGRLSIRYELMTGDIDAHYIFPYEVRNKVSEYISTLNNLPILSLFANSGFYTWLVLATAGYTVFHKKYRDLIVYVAPCISILVCIASPVNGEIRYMLPIVGAAPILVCWCYITGSSSAISDTPTAVYSTT